MGGILRAPIVVPVSPGTLRVVTSLPQITSARYRLPAPILIMPMGQMPASYLASFFDVGARAMWLIPPLLCLEGNMGSFLEAG